MSDFATTLKRIRIERGMTQEDFATFLGTSKQNISRYELGEVTPKISSFAKMAEKLGVSLAELNGGDDMESAPAEKVVNDPRREMVLHYLTTLSAENQDKWLDYAQLLLMRQKAAPDSRK